MSNKSLLVLIVLLLTGIIGIALIQSDEQSTMEPLFAGFPSIFAENFGEETIATAEEITP